MSGASSKPDAHSGSGMSSVGSAGVYQADDQRTVPDSEKNKAERFSEGKEHSHQPNDSIEAQTNARTTAEDERSIANRLSNEEQKGEDDAGRTSTKGAKTAEQKLAEEDPTAPAISHGNEPSKGAKIDKEIADEEAEIIAKMDAKKNK